MGHRKLIRLLLSGAAAMVLASGCDVMTSPEERVARAEQLLDKGAYAQALIEIKNVLRKRPDDVPALLALARTSLQIGDVAAASTALDRAAKAGVDKAQLAEARARTYQELGDNKTLLTSIDSGALDIKEPRRSEFRARALVGLRRCDDAIELARTLRRQDNGSSVTASLVLAECYSRSGNARGALAVLDDAVARQPKASEAWVARGRLQQLAAMTAEAEQSWITAAKYAPGQLTLPQWLNMLSALADLQLNRTDITAARATYEHMLGVAPQSVFTALVKARIDLRDGKTETAIAALRDLVNHHPDLDVTRLMLAGALLGSGSLEQALQQIATLTAKQPEAANLKRAADVARALAKKGRSETEEYWFNTAAAQVLLGQSAMARTSFTRAASLPGESMRATKALAQLELSEGNLDEALRLSQVVVAKLPDDAIGIALLAEAYRAQKQYPKAAEAIEKLWRRSPSAANAMALSRVRSVGKLGGEAEPLQQWLEGHGDALDVRAMYAEVLRRGGQNRQAIAEYERLVAKAPGSVAAINNLAWLYYLEKDDRAVATARRARQLAPQSPGVVDTYGWLLVETGSVGEGLKELEAAYRGGGIADPEIRYHYAAALARSGTTDRAKALLVELLADTPEFASRDAAKSLEANLK